MFDLTLQPLIVSGDNDLLALHHLADTSIFSSADALLFIGAR
jgi:hypothetical protein